MSWDVMLFSQDPGPLDGDMKVAPLGDAQFVREQISKSLPRVDWSEPAWGVLAGPGWSIEFNHEKSGPADSIMLHVRGGGDPLSAIVRLCKDTGWVAVDIQGGGLIDLNNPSDKSWQEFQGFREQMIATATKTMPPRPVSPHARVIGIGVSILAVVVMAWLVFRLIK